MQLFKAHKQWAERPLDERFQSVQQMHDACTAYREQAREASLPYAQLRVEAKGEELAIVGSAGVPATLSHWSMGQLSARAGAPASYLRSLPATLAAQNLNHGLKERGQGNPNEAASLMFHQNGSLILRSATSERYSRIWNNDITRRLLQLQQECPQWTNPMAYRVDGQGNGFKSIVDGSMVPSGLYASDHDMFAFLVDESKRLEGSPQGLNRGFFVWNSEVGASSFGVMTFLYDRVCGNNIVWGAKNVSEIRIRHVGQADDKAFRNLSLELRKYADSSASEAEAMIKAAKNYTLGASKDDALDALMSAIRKLRITDISQNRAEEALQIAEERQDRYGDPRTLWAAVSGLTEGSQAIPHTDQRTKVDRAAGKLLSIAF